MTLNGVEKTDEKIKFFYYPDVKITQIVNNVGPVTGGTTSYIAGVSFTHPNVCNPKVKYGALEVQPEMKEGFLKV